MAENKTRFTGASVDGFLAGLDDEERRRDSTKVLQIMERATTAKPKMWGPSIVGFGSYHYVYEAAAKATRRSSASRRAGGR